MEKAWIRGLDAGVMNFPCPNEARRVQFDANVSIRAGRTPSKRR